MLQQENDRLTNLTEALATILSFLEETNQDADLTVDRAGDSTRDSNYQQSGTSLGEFRKYPDSTSTIMELRLQQRIC